MNTNKRTFFIFFLYLMLMPIVNVQAAVGDTVCQDTQDTLRFLGYIILFAKILVPFAIIFMGTFDLYKSVISSKNEDLNKQLITLGKRVIAGLFIFFIPAILNASLTFINNWDSLESEWEICATCLLNPADCN